jgi:uncharacterized protein YkwD
VTPYFRSIAALLLLPASGLFAQPTPTSPDEIPALQAASEINSKAQALGEPWTVDINSREEVRQFYRTIYPISSHVESEWNGNTTTGDPGTTSAAFKEAVMNRINFYRALAGVPAVILNNATFSGKAQQAALIMSANNALSHDPADQPGWVHVTADGDEAAGKSNIGLGSRGPDTIDGYMRDHGAGNETVGHRRWLFHAPTREMGTGDVEQQGSFRPANSLWVQDAQLLTSRPATREEFVAWPPKGKIPAQLVWSRWSFALPGANFSGTTVSMTRNGSPISADLNATEGGSVLDPIIVWRYDGNSGNSLESHPISSADVDYQVTINNVNVGGSNRSFTYTVTVFDPQTPSSDFVATSLKVPSTVTTNTANSFSVALPTFASGLQWRELGSDPSGNGYYDGEGGAQNIIDGTSDSYSLGISGVAAVGNGAYHLATPALGTEFFILPSSFLVPPTGEGSLSFSSKLGFATANQAAQVEFSTNDGATWTSVYEQVGNGSGSSPTESSYQNHVIGLQDFAGQVLKIRFSYTHRGGNFFNQTEASAGWLMDEIRIQAAMAVTTVSLSAPTTGSTFSFSPSTEGIKILQARGVFFGNYGMNWGQASLFFVEKGSGSGGGGGSIGTDTSRIVNMSVRSVSGTGADALSVGMVVGGAGSKNLLIRVVGPTLGQLGVQGVIADPRLQLLRSVNGNNQAVTDTDNWNGDSTLTSLFSTLGAFPLTSNLDAAIAISLETAVYNAVVDTKGGSGVVLVEGYDTEAVTSGTARLVNVSARSQVGTGGDVLVAGFVISGTGNKTLLIRGVGASLGDFGVPGVLANPQLIVRNSNTSAVVADNDNWNNDASIASTAQTLGAFPLSSTADAALLVTLAPGVYTATVSGVSNTTGIALVEVYEVN